MTRKLPSPLSSLHSNYFEKMTVDKLEAVCQKKFEEGPTVMTGDEAAYLEEPTKLQAQSLLWFEQRVGWITSSKFFAAIRASLNPPTSPVKEIMERHNICKSVPAIQWGISM